MYYPRALFSSPLVTQRITPPPLRTARNPTAARVIWKFMPCRLFSLVALVLFWRKRNRPLLSNRRRYPENVRLPAHPPGFRVLHSQPHGGSTGVPSTCPEKSRYVVRRAGLYSPERSILHTGTAVLHWLDDGTRCCCDLLLPGCHCNEKCKRNVASYVLCYYIIFLIAIC